MKFPFSSSTCDRFHTLSFDSDYLQRITSYAPGRIESNEPKVQLWTNLCLNDGKSREFYRRTKKETTFGRGEAKSLNENESARLQEEG